MPNLLSTQTQAALTPQQLEAQAAARRAQQMAPTGAGAPVTGGAQTVTANPNAAGQLGPTPDSVNVRNPTPDWGGFNQFADATYADYTRRLDPQWQSARRAFDQQMINQGLAQGSEAYQGAFDDFTRSQNDAYGQARNASLASALAAQNQFFGQNLQESQLANALARAQMAAQAQTDSANIGANASMYNAGLSRESQMDQTALQRELGLGNLGLDADRLALMGNQADFGNLMQLWKMGTGLDQYNNGLLNSDFARGQGLLGLIPNVNPGNIDVTGPYNQQYQGQMAGWQQDQQNDNARNAAIGQGIGTLGMLMMLCDRDLKVPLGQVDSFSDRIKSVPVEMWRYRWESTPHVGTYAQEFNKAFGLPDRPFIDPKDMFGVLLGCVKELFARMDKLEAAHV